MAPSVMGSSRARLIALLGATMLLLALAGAPASAQQNGLVNVNVEDVVVQVPVALAANLCDVNVNVLAVQLRQGGATCDAQASSDAVFDPETEDGEAPTAQSGLVNVNLEDVTIQVPVAIAANICDVNANILALQARDGGAECTATSDSDAESA